MAVMTKWNEAWNGHSLDKAFELFSDDIVLKHWTGARVQGRDAFRHYQSGIV